MEIGDKIHWQSAGKTIKGLWLGKLDDLYDEVMITDAGGVQMGIQSKVPRISIQKQYAQVV